MIVEIILSFTIILFKSFIAYTAVIIVITIIKNLITSVIANRMYPYAFVKEKDDGISKEKLKELFKDCGATFMFKMNTVVLNATDNLVLSSFIGIGIVGLYSNYLLFYITIKTFANKVFSSFKASLGNIYASQDMKKCYFFFEVMNLLTIIIFGTACIGVALCADDLIYAWIGNDYLIAQPFSLLLGIEIFFVGIKLNLYQIRDVSGIFQKAWFRPIASVIINIVVSVILVQIIGIYGVLVGTIAADFLSNFLMDPVIIYKYSFKNYTSVKYYYLKNAIYFIILFIVGMVNMEACKYIIFENKWVTVISHILIIALTVPTSIILIFHKKEECKYLLDLGKKSLKESRD